jgi:hypothetical protein
MPRDREPWFKVKIGVRRSGKLAALPTDGARLGYFYLLAEAKVQRRMGEFDNRAHFAEVLGRFGRWLPDYVAAGLVHEAPLACDDCRRHHPGVRAGAIVVHDYLREQRDATHADRQAAYRDRVRDGDSDGHRDAVSDADRDGSSDVERDATGTADSRARRTTATATVTVNREEPRIYETEQETPRARPHRQRPDGLVDPSSNGNSPDHDEAAPW